MVVTSKLFNVSTIVRASILGAIGLMDGDRLKPNCSAAVLLPLALFMMLSCMRLSQQCSHPPPNAVSLIRGSQHQETHQVIIDQLMLSWMALKK